MKDVQARIHLQTLNTLHEMIQSHINKLDAIDAVPWIGVPAKMASLIEDVSLAIDCNEDRASRK